MSKLHLISAAFMACLFSVAGVSAQTRYSSAVAVQIKNQEPLLEIGRLTQAGRLSEAGHEIAVQLQKPDPAPNMKLLRCVVLANQKQTDVAMACLTALIKAHPNMLKAHNNPAVLQASLGLHEEAKRVLTLVLQHSPSVWTLHQNLQTLNVDMSRKTFARALQTDPSVKDTPPQLTMLATTGLKHAAAWPINRKPLAIPPSNFRDSRQAQPATRNPTPDAVVKSVSETRESEPSLNIDSEMREQVRTVVESWAAAWIGQNMDAYFADYAPSYTPSKQTSRTSWETKRTLRIAERRFVQVEVQNFSFQSSGQKFSVRFDHACKSDSISSAQRKRLDFVLTDNQWRIVRETLITRSL